jgi:hypothetical protein
MKWRIPLNKIGRMINNVIVNTILRVVVVLLYSLGGIILIMLMAIYVLPLDNGEQHFFTHINFLFMALTSLSCFLIGTWISNKFTNTDLYRSIKEKYTKKYFSDVLIAFCGNIVFLAIIATLFILLILAESLIFG